MLVNTKNSPVFISLFFIFFTAASGKTSPINSSSCPLNFKYIENLPWSSSICSQDPYSLKCCFMVEAVVYLGLAAHLRQTSTFFLPNSTYYLSSPCISAVQLQLATLGLDPPARICFGNSSSIFFGSPQNCPGISTSKDWTRIAGSTAAASLNKSCQGDLSSSTEACDSCFEEVDSVNSQMAMSNLDSNQTDCFLLSLLYAVGVVNQYGPLDNRTSTCVISRIYGVLETNKETSSSSSSSSSRRKILEFVLGVSGAVIVILVLVALICKSRIKNWRKLKDSSELESEDITTYYNESDGGLLLANIGMKLFSFQKLEDATNGFSQENLLGKGTFGVVYRGTLEDGSLAAIKELVMEVESILPNDHEFMNEIRIVGMIKHRNLLPLRGYCMMASNNRKVKRRFLVYDFMANGSVADHLCSVERRMELCWEHRRNIILDVAKGLLYLHCGVKPAIFHRDIKSSNILLDSEFRAKVADFGLAKQGIDGCSHITATRVAGTHGFLAPEYAIYGHLTEKTDIYSFGILILEIMTARKVIDSSSGSRVVLISDWAWNLVKSGNVSGVFDDTMMLMKKNEMCEGGEMERFVLVGILCAHTVAAHRPTIADALRMLEGGIEVPRIPERVSSAVV